MVNSELVPLERQDVSDDHYTVLVVAFLLSRMTTTLVLKRQARSEDTTTGQNGRPAITVAHIPHSYNKVKGHGYWFNPR